MSESPELRQRNGAVTGQPVALGPRFRSAPAGRGDSSAELRGGQPAFTSKQLMWMLAITMLGAVLRLYDLSEWSFWIDEAHTFRDVISSEEKFWNRGTSNYPLSYLLVRGLAEVFELAPGQLTEEIMRLPFAFFGIASLPALAIVARGMVGPRAALLAALFTALSPWHIYWSQNARSYSMVMFFCLLGMGTAFHGLHRRSWLMLIACVVFFFLAGFSHPSGYVIAATALFYLLLMSLLQPRRREGFSRWIPLLILGVFAVIGVALLPVFEKLQQIGNDKVSLFHLAQTMVFYVGMPVLMAAVGGSLYLFDRGRPAATFLTAIFVLPLLGLSIISASGIHHVTAQYAFAMLPAIYILAAALIMAIAEMFEGRGVRSMALKLVPLAMIVFHMLGQDYLYFKKQWGWRPRWEEAVRYIELQQGRTRYSHATILTTNGPSVRYYIDPDLYFGPSLQDGKITVEPMVVWNLKGNPEAFLDKIVARAKKRGEELWAIIEEPVLEEMDTLGRARDYFRNKFFQVRRLPNWTGPKDMTLLVYHYPRQD